MPPSIIIHDEYDYIIPECVMLSRDHLPHAELKIMKNCSHATFVEDPEAVVKVSCSKWVLPKCPHWDGHNSPLPCNQ